LSNQHETFFGWLFDLSQTRKLKLYVSKVPFQLKTFLVKAMKL
jgi:hypothetical protein